MQAPAQNSLVGDGFGGRLWYAPYNYTTGSYSAYTLCSSDCNNHNQLYGWGANQYGQLGNGTTSGAETPILIPGIDNVKYFTCGYCMALIKKDNSGWVWGTPWLQNSLGLTPVKVLDDAKFADAGTFLSCFVKNDGTVWSVGSNVSGSFGNGNKDAKTAIIPSQMIGVTDAVRVAVGQLTTTVLKNDGTVWAAGSNSRGGLGNNAALDVIAVTPVQVTGLKDIVDIKANEGANLALDKNGNVYAWGSNGWGCIGNGGPFGAFQNQVVPVKINGLSNIVAISGSDDGIHFMAIDDSHNCYVWGFNAYGQLGTGDFNEVLTPYLVATNVADIMAGETFSYIIKTDGSLWAAGGSLYTYTFTFKGSIWLNLNNTERRVFTQVNPAAAGINLCLPLKPLIANAAESGCGKIAVNALGGNAPFTYNIGKGAQTGNIFNNLAAGDYTIEVTDNNGCTQLAKTTLTHSNSFKNVAVVKTDPTCSIANGTVKIGAIHGGIAPYTYNINGGMFSADSFYTNLNAGNYSVNVQDAAGCLYNTSIELQNKILPPTLAIAGPNDTTSNFTAILHANEPAEGTGTWKIIAGGGHITNPDQYNSTITDLPFGKTILRWTIANACDTSWDDMEINVKFKKGDVFVPTAFTPNKDGLNDVFRFLANADAVITYFKVYNRWGELLYQSNNNTSAWNGMYKGVDQPAGIYIWTLYGKDKSGKIINLKGTVALIR